MPNVRIFTTDSRGNNTLIRTVVLDKHNRLVEVIDHATEEQREALSRSVNRRIKQGLQDLYSRNPDAIINLIREQEQASTVRT